MNTAVLAGPWAIVIALAAYRLTRLWIDDMIPPLPWLRERILAAADAREEAAHRSAQDADRADPQHQEAMDEAGKRALRGGYNAVVPRGPREVAYHERMARSGGQPTLAYLITCYWCAGFWIALAVALVAVLLPVAVWSVPFAVLAVSAVTGLLSTLAD